MHAQLGEIARDFEEASERLGRLAGELPDDLWPVRPGPDRWSVSECVEHLNITSEAFLPGLRAAIVEGRARGAFAAPRRLRRRLVGGLLWRVMGPPVRLVRVKTPERFVPTDVAPPKVLRARFEELQLQLLGCVEAADGLDLGRLRITSPFDARASYNVFAALGIVARHQLRHIWQAERAARLLAASEGHRNRAAGG